MRCGKCKESHETVNEVRNCYLGTNFPAGPGPVAQAQSEIPGAATETTPDFLQKSPSLPSVSDWGQFKALAAELPDLEKARYAVEIDGTLKFYQIDKPRDGRWAGYTFVKVQASDETYPVKNPKLNIKILSQILKDPAEAMLRYGKEIGRCGHCGRTLTNEESRERGIGPICYAKSEMGWLR
jgi:hypothetical protein